MRSALLAAAVLLASSSAALAQGLDRDTLLTDAPAVPDKGTLRVTGGATGTGDNGPSSGNNASGLSGTVQWTPLQNVAADVGAYFQAGAQGPAARVRYQLLNQFEHGIDLSTGVRFKTVGFHPNNGEMEFLLLAGRHFGRFELALNGVFGVETAAGGGKDAEVKGFAGFHLNDAVRFGLDNRLQVEVTDQAGAVQAGGVRNYDLTTGPALSWMMTKDIQLQGLVGMAQPIHTTITAPVGVVQASFDF